MLEFAWPWVFLLLPLPWLARRWLTPAVSHNTALKIHFLSDLEQLSGRKAKKLRLHWSQPLPFVLIWLLLLLAAARPERLGEPGPTLSTGRDLLLAVDLSGSMDTPDMLLAGELRSRLDAVKEMIGPFITTRYGDRVGLIVFAEHAYVHAPLSFDRHTVRLWLEEAHVGIAGQNTAIGEAIGLAIKRLKDTPDTGQRLLILITDGANNAGAVDPQTAALLAARQHIRIHCIGITPSASLNPESDQANIGADTNLLQAVADITGGQYFSASSPQALHEISQMLDKIEPAQRNEAILQTKTPLYMWPLGTAWTLGLGLLALRILPSFTWPKRGNQS